MKLSSGINSKLSSLLDSVITTAIITEGVDIGVVHADTTSRSVYGEYEQDSEHDALTIAKGYSRDRNRHLKQFKSVKRIRSRTTGPYVQTIHTQIR
jgi:transposase